MLLAEEWVRSAPVVEGRVGCALTGAETRWGIRLSAPVDVDVAALTVEAEVAGSSPKISVLLLGLGVLVLLISVPGLGSLLLGVGPTDCDLLVWGDGGKLE